MFGKHNRAPLCAVNGRLSGWKAQRKLRTVFQLNCIFFVKILGILRKSRATPLCD